MSLAFSMAPEKATDMDSCLHRSDGKGAECASHMVLLACFTPMAAMVVDGEVGERLKCGGVQTFDVGTKITALRREMVSVATWPTLINHQRNRDDGYQNEKRRTLGNERDTKMLMRQQDARRP